jgi:hypothetical protein
MAPQLDWEEEKSFIMQPPCSCLPCIMETQVNFSVYFCNAESKQNEIYYHMNKFRKLGFCSFLLRLPYFQSGLYFKNETFCKFWNMAELEA